MARLIFCSLFCLFFFASNAQDNSDESVYFFVRHAEKQKDGTSNPHLTEEGVLRANRLAQMLKSEAIDAVYSTNFYRTTETAKPIADQNGLEVIIYDHKAFDIDTFLKKTSGKRVVVVGHSNSTPTNVNAVLGEEKYQKIDESDYTHLYIVSVSQEKRDAVLLHLN